MSVSDNALKMVANSKRKLRRSQRCRWSGDLASPRTGRLLQSPRTTASCGELCLRAFEGGSYYRSVDWMLKTLLKALVEGQVKLAEGQGRLDEGQAKLAEGQGCSSRVRRGWRKRTLGSNRVMRSSKRVRPS